MLPRTKHLSIEQYLDPKPTHTIILEFQCQKHTTSVLHVGLHGGYTHVTHLSKWVDRFDNSKWLMVMLVQRIMFLTTYSIVWLLQHSWASQTWLVWKVSSTCNFPLRVATSGNYMVWTWSWCTVWSCIQCHRLNMCILYMGPGEPAVVDEGLWTRPVETDGFVPLEFFKSSSAATRSFNLDGMGGSTVCRYWSIPTGTALHWWMSIVLKLIHTSTIRY